MSEIFKVLNYLQCPAQVSPQGPAATAASPASVALVTHSLKLKGPSSTIPHPPPALLPLSLGFTCYLLEQHWPKACLAHYQICLNQNGGLENGQFSLPKTSLFQQAFQAILNASTWAEEKEGAWKSAQLVCLDDLLGDLERPAVKSTVTLSLDHALCTLGCILLSRYSGPHPLAWGAHFCLCIFSALGC